MSKQITWTVFSWWLATAWVISPVGADSENVLIVVADDLGVDILSCYGEGTAFPPTPTIDSLRNAGVLFRNAYADPTCSPTRATIQTGRYGFRTGVGGTVNRDGDNGLPLSEYIIPELLDLNPDLGYSHAAIGKWHLTTEDQGGYDAPNLYGYGFYSGQIWKDEFDSYYDWVKTENGVSFLTTVYATTDNVNEAVSWIAHQGDNPWFMWLAFNAPHSPYDIPPDALHSYDLDDDSPDDDVYRAMVEALDTELGRLLDSISDDVLARTNIIFLGDNGTPRSVTLPPFDPDHAKKTLYDGGINVPLIIAGPRVVTPGWESAEFVNTTDLFVTALEMMGVDGVSTLPLGTTLDSRSLLPIVSEWPHEPRPYVYSEVFNDAEPTEEHGQTLRNSTYKLIRFTVLQKEELYDLSSDPFETTDLLLGDLDSEQLANYNALTQTFDELLDAVCDGDTNGDSWVDPLDTGYILTRLNCVVGTGNAHCDVADANQDGSVDPLDVGYVLARFGTCD